MNQHRVWFKIILNPILRIIGWSIVSIVEKNKVIGYGVRKYPEHCSIEKNKTRNGRQKIRT